MTKRNRLEIKIEVLNYLWKNGEVNQTRLMYGINTNWGYIGVCLNELIASGLISCKVSLDNHNVYTLTDIGLLLLRAVTTMRETLGDA